jgi:hypothetical protein
MDWCLFISEHEFIISMAGPVGFIGNSINIWTQSKFGKRSIVGATTGRPGRATVHPYGTLKASRQNCDSATI